jgi:hypothetical protein
MNYKEYRKFEHEAKEPGIDCFVVYYDGDTVKGKQFVKKHNRITGKVKWTLDGKELDIENIRVYQDEEGFRIGKAFWGKTGYIGPQFERLVRGRIELFASATDNSRMQQVYNSRTQSYDTKVSGGTHTTFHLQKNNDLVAITYSSFKHAIADDPAALKQMDIEFQENGKPDRILNDYRAFIRILNIYNRSSK